MRLSRATAIAVLTACMLAAPAFAGYEYPLQSPEIRDAYFLGLQKDQQTIECLKAYAKRWNQTQSTKYIISEVDVMTPYMQIVERGMGEAPGDSEVQAETDLRAHPLRFLVKASVYFNTAFPNAAPNGAEEQGSGHSFSAKLSQGHAIVPLRTTVDSIYARHGPSGVMITVEVDPAKISSAPLHVIVNTPDGQSVSADFDLTKLK